MLKNFSYKSHKKQLPPFGKSLQALLQQGTKLKNNIFLFLGINAWNAAQNVMRNQHVLVLPPDHLPTEYEWPVQNYSVLAFDTGGLEPEFIEKTAHTLLVAGATDVYVALFNHKLVIYRRN